MREIGVSYWMRGLLELEQHGQDVSSKLLFALAVTCNVVASCVAGHERRHLQSRPRYLSPGKTSSSSIVRNMASGDCRYLSDRVMV